MLPISVFRELQTAPSQGGHLGPSSGIMSSPGLMLEGYYEDLEDDETFDSRWERLRTVYYEQNQIGTISTNRGLNAILYNPK